MSKFPTAHKPQPKNHDPLFLKLARGFYGDAFGARKKQAISEAMADWADLTEDEQSFALAHLHYLDLLAQAGTQELLIQVRELLDELIEQVGEALEGGVGFAGFEELAQDLGEDGFTIDEPPQVAPPAADEQPDVPASAVSGDAIIEDDAVPMSFDEAQALAHQEE